ncbi:hypothetical protein ACGGZG_004585, partial [Salmonella enterica]
NFHENLLLEGQKCKKQKEDRRIEAIKLIAKGKHRSFKKDVYSSSSYMKGSSIKPRHFHKVSPYYKNCMG